MFSWVRSESHGKPTYSLNIKTKGEDVLKFK